MIPDSKRGRAAAEEMEGGVGEGFRPSLGLGVVATPRKERETGGPARSAVSP